MMKKISLVLVIICSMSFILTACNLSRGNVKNISIIDVESKVYSKEDIKAGEQEVVEYFKKNFGGCTLKELKYVGDDKNNDFLEFATRNDATEVMVFLSIFNVDSSGGDGSLDPNSTYEGWNWILVKDKSGNWQHVDHGY